ENPPIPTRSRIGQGPPKRQSRLGGFRRIQPKDVTRQPFPAVCRAAASQVPADACPLYAPARRAYKARKMTYHVFIIRITCPAL
ncbi:MAG: hypothetical protein KI788_20870, partial [Mameliella sp.]|nr:hypothetical protein [Mameliella sp.]